MNVKSINNYTLKIHLFPEEARSFFIKKSGFDVYGYPIVQITK